METNPPRVSAPRQVVVFGLAEELYAVDVQRVQEIIRWRAPRTVAGAVPGVCGVINLRGKIIPVCDLSLTIGAPPIGHDDQAKIVVLENAFGVCGFVVDRVEEVASFESASVDEMPPLASDADFVVGIAKVGDRLIVVLDPDRLFDASVADDAAARGSAVDELAVAA